MMVFCVGIGEGLALMRFKDRPVLYVELNGICPPNFGIDSVILNHLKSKYQSIWREIPSSHARP